ncbi:DNA polymerase epsilon catalytic subunit A-like [Asparagus officinalis]|uniref:DNA polymerase epsilon catalytic subunit A-like n=1 Tax=Asparagus officinalis TaxID=4686 RepID=UPI00098E1648|nr:DNA polymerase epsilon catalytic subunit A-like [Asparagus officinalis]
MVRNAQDGWNMSELQMKTTAECSYLEKGIPFFYLYHSFLEGRGIYIAYIAVSSTISAIVVDPFQNKELSSSLLEKQFHEACQALSIDPPAPGSRITFKVDYVKSIEAGEQHLQRALTEFRVKNFGPTVGLIESPNFQSIKSAIRVLDDFPCVSIPCNARDSCYQVLGWQVTAGKIGMQRCAASSQWLNERVLLSRYAHIPLGNFEVDWILFTADVLFSRALRDQQQILWTSDDGIPDLGGIFEGDTCFVDEVSQPAFTYPGAYRRVAVELKIHHLAVNALLKSSQIEEMEGVSLFGYDHEMHSGSHVPETDFDETTSCAPAFRELKRLIRRCISDVVTSENVFADAIQQHLYRWLCSPLSKLHDPALHRVLHKVMEKIFAHLLVELQKLGATLIFANFSKIIIDTGKIDLPAAHEYCYSLLKNLKSRDLFERIKLEPLHFWHYFLFMDQYNYGGIQAKITTGSDVEITEDESQVETISSWNIAEYLPKETQDHFILIASEFMYKPWKYSREQIRTRMATTVGSTFTPSAERLEASVTEYLKGQKKIDEGDSKNRGLPQMSDSNPYKGDAASEFIKHVCAVLSLDHNVQHDILKMREKLLMIVLGKEFSPPCPSFKLANVICSYCNDCRDLELRRDSSLLDQEWCCAVPQCGQPYNREHMENYLLQIVRQRERLYHLQDLVCLGCGQVKGTLLAEQCACGGLFRCKESASEFQSRMLLFRDISIRQKFQLLQECICWILEEP